MAYVLDQKYIKSPTLWTPQNFYVNREIFNNID